MRRSSIARQVRGLRQPPSQVRRTLEAAFTLAYPEQAANRVRVGPLRDWARRKLRAVESVPVDSEPKVQMSGCCFVRQSW